MSGNFLDIVRKYNEKGWILHPLSSPDDKGKSPGKRPLLPEWQKLEKTPENIGKYITEGCNIGLVCGVKSGVTVIDKDHMLFWENITRDLGLFTLESQRTEGRGHSYFVYSSELKNKKSHILGIEILSDGSNAVLPPSKHASGETYRWLNPDAPLSPMPPILMERLNLLFKAEENLVRYIGECRPCFKKLWNNGEPEVLHGADGRETMLAWATELKAKGAELDEILMLARLIYKNEFSSKGTAQEWKNIKSKPWTCRKIKERLSGIISCADCLLEKKRNADAIYELTQLRIANAIMVGNFFITFEETDEIWYYKDGVYCLFGEVHIKKQAQAMKNDISIHWLNEVINSIKIRTYKKMDIIDEFRDFVCLENGVLNLRTLQLEPHTSDKIFLYQLPIIYDKSATCPQIDKFLTDVLPEEYVHVIEEFFGYCLVHGYPIQIAFMLFGIGANGKSTLLALLKEFLGKQNTASISLQELEENKFALANLFGKRANIFADLPPKALASTGIFKVLTGGDQITAEKKFGGFFSFVNSAKLIYSANRLPMTYDNSDAFFRRWVIIPFPKVFSGEAADKKLIEKLTTEKELSGLLNRALAGLSRLMRTWEFSMVRSVEETRELYVRLSNSVRAFLWDCIEVNSEEWIEKKALYQAYVGYCTNAKLPAVSEKAFSQSLIRNSRVEDYRPNVNGRRPSAWKGVMFKAETTQALDKERKLTDWTEKDVKILDQALDNAKSDSSRGNNQNLSSILVKDVNDSFHCSKEIISDLEDEKLKGIRSYNREIPDIPDISDDSSTEIDSERGRSGIRDRLRIEPEEVVNFLKKEYDKICKPEDRVWLERLINSMRTNLSLRFEMDDEDAARYVNDYCQVRGWL